MIRYQKIIEYLNECIEKDALSHAYIFYGPDEIKKNDVARQFADKILNINESKWHPDLFVIKTEINEEVTINLIRQLKKFLILRPYLGKHKVVIIENGERLNAYAQNALLKIYEEAPAHAVVMLCVKTLDSVSETIISRGVKLPFWGLKRDECDDKFSKIFSELIASGFSGRYNSIEKLSGLEPILIFANWINFLRNKFLENPDLKTAKLVRKSQDIYFKLNETNYNPKLAYDELILNLEIK